MSRRKVSEQWKLQLNCGAVFTQPTEPGSFESATQEWASLMAGETAMQGYLSSITNPVFLEEMKSLSIISQRASEATALNLTWFCTAPPTEMMEPYKKAFAIHMSTFSRYWWLTWRTHGYPLWGDGTDFPERRPYWKKWCQDAPQTGRIIVHTPGTPGGGVPENIITINTQWIEDDLGVWNANYGPEMRMLQAKYPIGRLKVLGRRHIISGDGCVETIAEMHRLGALPEHLSACSLFSCKLDAENMDINRGAELFEDWLEILRDNTVAPWYYCKATRDYSDERSVGDLPQYFKTWAASRYSTDRFNYIYESKINVAILSNDSRVLEVLKEDYKLTGIKYHFTRAIDRKRNSPFILHLRLSTSSDSNYHWDKIKETLKRFSTSFLMYNKTGKNFHLGNLKEYLSKWTSASNFKEIIKHDFPK